MNSNAFPNILGFFVLFFGIVIVQHVLMRIIYPIFRTVKSMPFSTPFNVPTVMFHEIIGHLLPAIFTGSRITGIDLGQVKGNVSISYQKNFFGMISVFIASVGPTFILPLFFIVVYYYLYGYDIYSLLHGFDIMKLVSDVSNVDSIYDIVLIYLAIVLAPSSASSSMDMQAAIKFMRESPFLVLFWLIVIVFLLYYSLELRFDIVSYARNIVITAFLSYVFMYSLSLPFYYAFSKRVLLQSFVGGVIIFFVKLVLFGSSYALYYGLAAFSLIAILKGLKINMRIF